MSAKRRRQLQVLFRYVIDRAQEQDRRWVLGLCNDRDEIMEELLNKEELKPGLGDLTLVDVKIAAGVCRPMLFQTDVADILERAIDAWEAALPIAKEYLEDFENSKEKCGQGGVCR